MAHGPVRQSRTSGAPDGNAVVTRQVNASADAVWAVLANGWMYSTWVVGASRIRAVERQWPAAQSRVHHSFGVWPVLLDDHTQVLDCDPGRGLLLKARGWPAGEAHVRIQIAQGNTPAASTVSIVEDATSGPARLIPRRVRQLFITARNTEALRRLACIAEGRTTPAQ